MTARFELPPHPPRPEAVKLALARYAAPCPRILATPSEIADRVQAADYLPENGCKVRVAETHGALRVEARRALPLVFAQLDRREEGHSRQKVKVDTDDNVWLVTDKGREHLPGIDTIVFASAA
jgi:hypothetical protein